MSSLPSLDQIAKALGGEVSCGQIRAPGPNHSPQDRSLSVKLDTEAPDGFVVNSFSGDDAIACRDHVRRKLGLPTFEHRIAGSSGKSRKGNGAAKAWSLIVARYVYRDKDGAPFLQVCRTDAKTFFQNRWNGQMWVSGKPQGPKIPYRLPELVAAPPTTKIHITEGEKDADALAKLGFIATTNSEGAANWTDDFNEYFRDRHVYVHEDNDQEGRKRVQRIARALHSIAASVRVIRLPGLPPKGDVSDWLDNDPSGARLIKECESSPIWEPSTPAPHGDITDDEDTDHILIKKKQADVLIELASSAELFHDRDDVGYARFEVNGHKENWRIRSTGFKRWLTRAFYENTQSAPASEGIHAALDVLEARAQFDGPEHEVHVRVAGHEGTIYIDLVDKDWRAIEIDEDGWRVVDNPPVYFRRSSGMKPLPEPVAGGSLKDDLRPLLNVKTEHEFVLAVAWLLAALRPRGPYPVEALIGEHGSAKTAFANMLRALIDPNSVPLRALPRSEHDLFIAARNSHVLGYDNVSGLPVWLSDAFCRLATGGGFSTRQLYTDQDEVLFGSTRPIILNGIDDITTRGDLADRSIVETLSPIPDEKRKLETELWAEFERKRPLILGALFAAVSHGLRSLPNVVLERKPRMADFAFWITACEGALWPKGTFLEAYTANLTDAIETVLEADQVAPTLRKYMEGKASFEGTASELIKVLNEVTSEAEQKAKGWPKRSNALSKILRRIAPPLRKAGIDITFERDSRRKWIVITPFKAGKTSSSRSPSSSVSDSNELPMTIPDRGSSPVLGGSSSAGDGDDRGGDPHGEIVTSKLLQSKGNDDGDAGGDHFSNVTGKRICAESFGPPDKDNRFRVVGTCPPGTCCMRCYSDAAQVLKIADGDVIGGESQPLHRECAGPWFDQEDEPGFADNAGEIEPSLTARCAQCNGVPDGKERLRSIQGRMIWLHPECERHYIADHELPW
jgi:hypothetical protein